jgi:hypothetical protein
MELSGEKSEVPTTYRTICNGGPGMCTVKNVSAPRHVLRAISPGKGNANERKLRVNEVL